MLTTSRFGRQFSDATQQQKAPADFAQSQEVEIFKIKINKSPTD